MRRAAAIILPGLVFAGASWAQPAPQKTNSELETVIVTAPRLSDEVKATIHNFVSNYTATSPDVTVAEIPRWHNPLCPETLGLSQAVDQFVAERVREIAQQVGARVANETCTKNVEIIFTAQPQTLIDAVSAKNPGVLGYHFAAETQKLKTVRYPIQAWYATATRDYDGKVFLDTNDIRVMRPGCQFAICDMLATTDDKGTQGSLLRTGLQSEFVNVYIIVDAIKTGDYSIGAIADHIAMLALSRTEAFDACQPLPSIANLTAPNCDRKTSAITQTDLAYLKGIYSMDAGANLVIQQSTISAKIEAAITGQQ